MEAIVSRMKTVRASVASGSNSGGSLLRFIAVSATIPNVDDVRREGERERERERIELFLYIDSSMAWI